MILPWFRLQYNVKVAVIFIFEIVLSESIVESLEVPTNLILSAVYPNSLQVSWWSVGNSDGQPDGYKIKLWQVDTTSRTALILVNGDETPGYVTDIKPKEHFSKNVTYKSDPRVIVVNGPEEKKIVIDKINYNVIYEVRIQAFNNVSDGPLSEPVRMKVVRTDGRMFSVQRYVDNCVVSISAETDVRDSSITHYHDSYF